MATSVPDGVSDAELVIAAEAGDKAAFGELTWRHRPLAVGVCSRFLGDPELATDVVQEAVLVALVELPRLADPERFGSWLCGISLNIARQRLRRRDRLAEVPLDAVTYQMAWADRDSDPAEAAEQTELRRRVQLAIADLAPGQREAVLLFYLHGLSYREVAMELSISVNAVKARLHQARAALEPRLAHEKTKPLPHRKDTAMADDGYTDVRVTEVRRSPDGDPVRRRHVIVLEEVEGARRLPIWVGPAEATALALDLENVMLPRPLTYRFAADLLASSGARVSEVRITQLREGTFYAIVVLDVGRERREVDARPSDALNLAVVTDAPMRVGTQLLDESEAHGNHRGWRDYEVAGPVMAAEVQAAIEQELQRLSDEAC